MDIWCSYSTCKNYECEKHYPKHRLREAVQAFMQRGISPHFLIWSEEQMDNNKPKCFKAV